MSKRAETLPRLRERFAMGQVEGWDHRWAKDAMTRAQGLPVQLRSQGLSTTVAWLLRVGSADAIALAQLLAEWLLKDGPCHPLGREDRPAARRLLELCVQAERTAYLAAQAEALAVLEPVKLLARVIHGEDQPDAR